MTYIRIILKSLRSFYVRLEFQAQFKQNQRDGKKDLRKCLTGLEIVYVFTTPNPSESRTLS